MLRCRSTSLQINDELAFGEDMKYARLWLAVWLLGVCIPCWAQPSAKRKVIIDQDAAGPAGSDQQAILLLIQSPQTEVLASPW